ncbi:MAG: S-adenosylmethionine:tRNA ribosyltransferase-isomerase, partial [Pseudomonadota bacterium]
MRVDQFDFDLPEARIALEPANPRDSARLLHVRGMACADRHITTTASRARRTHRLQLGRD